MIDWDINHSILINNNYRLDLQATPDGNFQSGKEYSFTSTMQDLNGNRVSEVEAWVRVSKNGKTYFQSSDFIVDDGTIDFSYTFPEGGEYSVLVRSVDSVRNQEATVTHVLEVEGDQLPQIGNQLPAPTTSSLVLLLILVILGIAGYIYSKFTRVVEEE